MALSTYTGTIIVRERIAVPPGAVATVKLVDGDGEVLAAAALEFTGAPVEFTLTADDALATGDLLVWAMVRTDFGVWGTLELAPYTADFSVALTRVEE